MARQRLKVIPDRIFHKLWEAAGEYDDRDAFISDHAQDRTLFDHPRYGLSYPECLELLKNTYEYRKMSFKEITDELSLKKSDISHIFCNELHYFLIRE